MSECVCGGEDRRCQGLLSIAGARGSSLWKICKIDLYSLALAVLLEIFETEGRQASSLSLARDGAAVIYGGGLIGREIRDDGDTMDSAASYNYWATNMHKLLRLSALDSVCSFSAEHEGALIQDRGSSTRQIVYRHIWKTSS